MFGVVCKATFSPGSAKDIKLWTHRQNVDLLKGGTVSFFNSDQIQGGQFFDNLDQSEETYETWTRFWKIYPSLGHRQHFWNILISSGRGTKTWNPFFEHILQRSWAQRGTFLEYFTQILWGYVNVNPYETHRQNFLEHFDGGWRYENMKLMGTLYQNWHQVLRDIQNMGHTKQGILLFLPPVFVEVRQRRPIGDIFKNVVTSSVGGTKTLVLRKPFWEI